MARPSDNLSTRKPIFPWRRFWCPRGGPINLSDHGFMLDPESEFILIDRPQPLTLEQISSHRALVLLGEPGMGKSTTLEQEVTRLRQREAHAAAAIKVDLRDFSGDELLYRRVFESPEFLEWARGTSQLVLHLDSLDEALLRIDSIASLLASELPRHPAERLAIRIACRTLVWPVHTLEPVLRQMWGDAAVGVFELAPLRRTDVKTAATLYNLDSVDFIRSVFEADAVPLAIKPLTLKMLLETYKRDTRLPKSNRELYRRGCLLLCEDFSDSRRDSRRLGQLSAPQRRRVAGRIAAVTMLANRYAIWTGAESGDVPAEDVRISALTGETEDVDPDTFKVSEPNLREVLDTGLFSARGPERMGWAHQAYAEFLAADYLVEKQVSPNTVLKLLRHPDGGLIPQLFAVAAWLTSLSPEVRHALIESEPLVLLRSDLSRWPDEDIAALAVAHLKALDERRSSDFQLNIASLYPRLMHNGLVALLRQHIGASNKSIMSRRAAVMIAEACALTELESDLLTLAMNLAEDPSLRAYAVAALRTCGREEIRPRLLPLAKGVAGEDPQDELRGHALQLLWPKYLSVKDLFANVVTPNEGFTGSYAMFLYALPESLEVIDLPEALSWTRSYIASTDHYGVFQLNALADSILVRAWVHTDSPSVLNPLIAYIRECFARGGSLFRGTENRNREEFQSKLKSEAEPRLRLLRTLAKEQLERIEVYPFKRESLLQPEDLEWLLRVAPGGDAADPELNEVTLCNFVENVYGLGNGRDFEQLQSAAERWPLLYERYRFLFEGIPIDSPEARAARENHRLMQTFKQPKPLLSPAPAERVADALSRFEGGNWRAFWQLNLHLTLTPTSQFYGPELEFDITKLPGWLAADAATHERIVNAADQYLRIGKTSVRSWIGTTQCNHNDLAAFRALLLLRKQKLEAYTGISADVWRKWAPAIAALPRLDDEKFPDDQAVVRDALEKAPAEFSAAICKMIRCERRDSAAAENKSPPGARFLRLQSMKFCWQHPTLCEGAFSELKNANNSEEEFTALAEILISEQYAPARDYVLARLREGTLKEEGIAVAVVNILLAHCVAESWAEIWPLVRENDEFARRVFLSRVQFRAFRRDALASLPEKDLGELYVRMEQLFPRKNDPVHPSGTVHAVGPIEQVAHLRDSLLSELVGRGTSEAVSALKSASAQLPELQWLPLRVRDAEQIMRVRTWKPLSVSEVRKVIASRRARFVQVPRDLADVLLESLSRYQAELHGEQASIRTLWDRQGSGDTFRPVEEDALSDRVKQFLQRDLTRSAIVVNREVEVSRIPGAPVGTRTDIRVQAIRRDPEGNVLDVITAVIETKGCWNRELFTSLKNQLHDDYMMRLSAPVGVYLVGWFDRAKWDSSDRRRSKVPNLRADEAQRRLALQAAALPKGSDVQAVVLDCHLPRSRPARPKMIRPSRRRRASGVAN